MTTETLVTEERATASAPFVAAPTVELVTLYTRILRELTWTPCISHEKLARRLDVTMRTIQRHMEHLEQEDYITVNRDHRPFAYTIMANGDVPHLDGWLVCDLLGGAHE